MVETHGEEAKTGPHSALTQNLHVYHYPPNSFADRALLICEASELLLCTENGRWSAAFTAKVREVCATEAEQELKLRGELLDERTCLRLARNKTGPLFAFVGQVCGGTNEVLSTALEEASYRLGTA